MAMRRSDFSQALVRSTGQRWRACGSGVRGRRWRPRQTCRVEVPGGIGSPARRGLLRCGSKPRARSSWVELVGEVASVGPDLERFEATRAERVEQRQQVGAFVLVAGAEADLQRDAGGVDDQVVAAAGPAQKRARDLLAPFFAVTNEQSTITRDQSKRSPAASSSCKTWISLGNRP